MLSMVNAVMKQDIRVNVRLVQHPLESIMNIKKISAAVLMLSLAGAALAEAPYPEDTKFVSTKTRAEVIAELAQARANGELPINDVSYPDKAMASAVSTKTRAEVIDELKQARANGELPINDATYPDKAIASAPVSTKTRAQVVEELKQYQQAHANPSYAELIFLR